MLKDYFRYGKTAFEETPGVLSAMRCVSIPGSFIILLPVMTIWTWSSLKHGGPAAIDHATGWMFVSLFLGVNGAKVAQAFAP